RPSSDLTDASMDVLAGMEHLQAVNLYRTRVTNSGAARLQGLKELTDIDLRYSRVTSNGVESLRAALPNSKVQFAGSSMVRPKTAGAEGPPGNSDKARGGGGKGRGGRGEFGGGRLRGMGLSRT